MDEMIMVTRRFLWLGVGAFQASFPWRPYSAVPFPSNSELWRNFPDAPQHPDTVKIAAWLGVSGEGSARTIFLAAASCCLERRLQLLVGGMRNMTISWLWRLLALWGEAEG